MDTAKQTQVEKQTKPTPTLHSMYGIMKGKISLESEEVSRKVRRGVWDEYLRDKKKEWKSKP